MFYDHYFFLSKLCTASTLLQCVSITYYSHIRIGSSYLVLISSCVKTRTIVHPNHFYQPPKKKKKKQPPIFQPIYISHLIQLEQPPTTVLILGHYCNFIKSGHAFWQLFMTRVPPGDSLITHPPRTPLPKIRPFVHTDLPLFLCINVSCAHPRFL